MSEETELPEVDPDVARTQDIMLTAITGMQGYYGEDAWRLVYPLVRSLAPAHLATALWLEATKGVAIPDEEAANLVLIGVVQSISNLFKNGVLVPPHAPPADPPTAH